MFHWQSIGSPHFANIHIFEKLYIFSSDKFEILSKNNLLQSQPASATLLPLFAGSLPLEK
jgi:hypothetical protein